MSNFFMVSFPDKYPELLEQMGQIIGRKLVEYGLPHEKAQLAAFDISESIRIEIGGMYQYIPRGLRFDLSKRDREIYAKFDGRNHHHLARTHKLSEMQIRNIVNRARLAEIASKQTSLL